MPRAAERAAGRGVLTEVAAARHAGVTPTERGRGATREATEESVVCYLQSMFRSLVLGNLTRCVTPEGTIGLTVTASSALENRNEATIADGAVGPKPDKHVGTSCYGRTVGARAGPDVVSPAPRLQCGIRGMATIVHRHLVIGTGKKPLQVSRTKSCVRDSCDSPYRSSIPYPCTQNGLRPAGRRHSASPSCIPCSHRSSSLTPRPCSMQRLCRMSLVECQSSASPCCP